MAVGVSIFPLGLSWRTLSCFIAVYTCQKPQPTRCDFFIWGDEAKGREAAMVLNNSRSEPELNPQTPSRSINARSINENGYITPQTERRTPYTPSKKPSIIPGAHTTSSTATTQNESAEEFYDWPLSDDEELSKVADQASSQSQNSMPPPETPRKAVKVDSFSTPGKRRFDEMENGAGTSLPTPISGRKEDDVFMTPGTGVGGKHLFSTPGPQDTPTPVRFKDVAPTATTDSSLATELLKTLKAAQVVLPSNVRDEIRELCNKQSLFTNGVIRGRDISRSLIAKRDEKIVELQGSIEALQSERETSRAVIRHLRRELGVAKTSNG